MGGAGAAGSGVEPLRIPQPPCPLPGSLRRAPAPPVFERASGALLHLHRDDALLAAALRGVVALHQQDDRAPRVAYRLAQLGHRSDIFAVGAKNDFAGAQTGFRRRTVRFRDHHAAAGVQLASFGGAELAHAQPQGFELVGAAAAAAGTSHRRLVLEFLDGHADVPRALAPPDLQVGAGAGADPGDQRRQFRGLFDLAAIDAEDDVFGLQAGLVGRSAAVDGTHGRAARPIEPEALG